MTMTNGFNNGQALYRGMTIPLKDEVYTYHMVETFLHGIHITL